MSSAKRDLSDVSPTNCDLAASDLRDDVGIVPYDSRMGETSANRRDAQRVPYESRSGSAVIFKGFVGDGSPVPRAESYIYQ